jgi:SAM-dependent methyltransferase
MNSIETARERPKILRHEFAELHIQVLPDGKKHVSVRPLKPDFFVSRLTVVTTYPDELIELILSIKGPAWVCDEIARDEDPTYIRFELETDLLAHFAVEEFRDKRILDFGSGSGASTMILHRMFPTATIVGAELDPDLLTIARKRAEHYSFPQSNLLLSPRATDLPPRLGEFDFVIMSAVYEHLLPAERNILLPKLWSIIKDRGSLFLDQTPNRYFPFEGHTTGLPFLNYLPERLACRVACRFSKKVKRGEPWEGLLRKGIRGATAHEILGILRRTGNGIPILLKPDRNGVRDHIDLWFAVASARRRRLVKKVVRDVSKVIHFCTGALPVPSLALAIRKERQPLRKQAQRPSRVILG